MKSIGGTKLGAPSEERIVSDGCAEGKTALGGCLLRKRLVPRRRQRLPGGAGYCVRRGGRSAGRPDAGLTLHAMLRWARRQIRRVAAVGACCSHWLHSARTHAALSLAASLSQLATESCT